ncbi:hypothetical protein PJ267_03215 [Arthrobacter sp. OVS8]|nr:hypothetical protein PJ267_03215 [Arthrobacter sp. OVS8]
MSWKRSFSALCAAALILAGGLVTAAPAQAAYPTYGAIGAFYRAHASALGVPTSAEHTGFRDRVQHFRNGTVYWSASTGAHWVHGGILSAYRAQGGDAGKLGLPVSEELLTVGGGVYQQFSKGVVYWTRALGAHGTVGAIRSRYAKLGAEKGTLGYPTSGELKTTGYGQPVVYQRFQRGIITWNGTVQNFNDLQAHEISGAIYNKVMALGGIPAVGSVFNAPERVQASKWTFGVTDAVGQRFQRGLIISSAVTGTHLIPRWTGRYNNFSVDHWGLPVTDEFREGSLPTVCFQYAYTRNWGNGEFGVWDGSSSMPSCVSRSPVPLPPQYPPPS